MKILHCVEFYYPHIGGAEKHVQILSEYFSNLGNETHVVTSKIYNRKNKILNNVKIIEFDIKGNAVRGYNGDTKSYQNFLINSNYDLIVFYAAQQWTFDLALEIIEKIKPKKIFIPCGFSKFNNLLYKPYYSRLKLKINNFQNVICFGKSLRDYNFLKENFNKKIDIIYNGSFKIEKKKRKF